MLNDAQIKELREALIAELNGLAKGDEASATDRATVELDQQSVGRLSRMDALQRQAMAQATSRRRASREARIEAALKRMDQGEYGFCLDCGEDIDAKRLAFDPTVPKCLSCAKG